MNRKLIAIHLHGPLGERFGALHHFAVGSPQEAVRALDANYPGFIPAFLEHGEYGLMVDGDWRGGDDAPQLPASKEIHIVPHVAGNTPLVVIALGFIGITGTAATIIGSLLVAGLMIGVSLLFRPKPPGKKDPDEKDADSFIFSGPENVTGQGVAVPLIYGRVFAGSVVVSAGQDTVDTHTTPPAPAAAPPATGSSTVNPVSSWKGDEIHPSEPVKSRDNDPSPSRMGRMTARLAAITPLAVAPTSWLVTSYDPAMRNDFSGEAGMSLQLAAARQISWMGVLVTTDNAGTRTVNLYDENDQSVLLRTATIDVTGAVAGTYAWASIAPFTLAAGTTYFLVSAVEDGGHDWGETAPATFRPEVIACTAVFRAGGEFNSAEDFNQYVGLDLGWEEVPPEPIDPEDMLDPLVDLWNEGGGTDHLLDPPVEGWPAIIEDPAYGFRPEGWVLVKVVWATDEEDANRKQVMVWQPDYETAEYVYNWNMVKGFYVTEFIEEYEDTVDGETVTVEGVVAAIEPEDDEWINGADIESNPVEDPSP